MVWLVAMMMWEAAGVWSGGLCGCSFGIVSWMGTRALIRWRDWGSTVLGLVGSVVVRFV